MGHGSKGSHRLEGEVVQEPVVQLIWQASVLGEQRGGDWFCCKAGGKARLQKASRCNSLINNI